VEIVELTQVERLEGKKKAGTGGGEICNKKAIKKKKKITGQPGVPGQREPILSEDLLENPAGR